MLRTKFNYLTKESILRLRECILHYVCVRCSECNCTNIIDACYFCLFWVSWIQIGCSLCVLYADCMNMLQIIPTLISSLGGHICIGSTWVGVCVWIPYVARVACRRALSAMNTIWTVMSLGVPWVKGRHDRNQIYSLVKTLF